MIFKSCLMSLAVGALATVSSFGSTIDLGINGDALVGPTFINFGNYPMGTDYSTGTGAFVVSQVPTGLFSSLGVQGGDTGKITSLNAAATPPGVISSPNPVTATPFMTFDATPNLKVFITELLPGSTLGPFSLTDNPNGATASFAIDGFTYNSADMTEEQITGLFSATFVNISVAQLLATEASGSPIPTPFSATFDVTAVPEPASLLLLGGGLFVAGLVSRRKARK